MSQSTYVSGDFSVVKDFYSDCTIHISGGESFSAHRVILHLHSPVFKELLSEKAGKGEDGGVVLDLKDDDPDALRTMLHFFYHGVIELTCSLPLYVTVFQIANNYQVSDLKTHAYDQFFNILFNESWTANDLIDAAIKLEDTVNATEETARMRGKILEAVSKRSCGLYNDPSFKNFIQEYPEWVIDLLKIYDPESRSLDGGDQGPGGNGSGNDHDADEGNHWGLDSTHDQHNTNIDTENSYEPTTSLFTIPGRTLGVNAVPRPGPFYGPGIRDPPSDAFKARSEAMKKIFD